MKKSLLLLLVFLSNFIHANAVLIDENTSSYNLLSSSFIYIDKSKTKNIEEIKNKKLLFIKNEKSVLSYGYSPNFNVWLKFSLKNTSNKSIEKILEYQNSLTSNIDFFAENRHETDGLLNINSARRTINPSFKIQLNAYEQKTYYLKVSSHITSLIVKLKLWEEDDFYAQEIQHQVILALFFGAMLILAIYNLFLYFFTKDISYFYYVLYVLGIVIHHLMYVGMANIYLLKASSLPLVVNLASFIVSFPIFALALFTKKSLNIKKYRRINFILNTFLILIPLSVLFFVLSDSYDKYRNVLNLLLLLYLVFITIYAVIKKVRAAYFILFGWFLITLAIVLMFISSAGIFDFYEYFPYMIESMLLGEVIIFAIALADRINYLQKDKEEAKNKLITQQENEKYRLEIKVNEKTKDLKIALNEKGLLLKELNHRVKNNMQTIVSLIRLQSDEIHDENTRDLFLTIQNRISAMSHLHELLYTQDNISHINAYEYFDILINELKDSYANNISIHYNIQCKLKMQQAIYCGLILNELISNSFKYAFINKEGNINISLSKSKEQYKLEVSDDGIGYDKNISWTSLGIVLVNTLAVSQLKGTININSKNGVYVEITWNENA